ncbi:hypothetical protein EAY82_23285 [Vibrio anguillarum]|nr:hypothetical protein [Vibrio anguillarum]
MAIPLEPLVIQAKVFNLKLEYHKKRAKVNYNMSTCSYCNLILTNRRNYQCQEIHAALYTYQT